MNARRLAPTVAVLAAVVALIAFLNWWLCERPLGQAIASDPKYDGIVAHAHFGHYVAPRTLVVDVREVPESTKRVVFFRVLLAYAQAQSANRFDSVQLAFRGETRFVLKGRYFQSLGVDAPDQNPIYVVRMFPQNTERADGTQAFPTRSGGDFPTIAMQLQDFNELHDQWYRKP